MKRTALVVAASLFALFALSGCSEPADEHDLAAVEKVMAQTDRTLYKTVLALDGELGAHTPDMGTGRFHECESGDGFWYYTASVDLVHRKPKQRPSLSRERPAVVEALTSNGFVIENGPSDEIVGNRGGGTGRVTVQDRSDGGGEVYRFENTSPCTRLPDGAQTIAETTSASFSVADWPR